MAMSWSRRPIALVAMAATLSLGLAACGSDSEDESAAPTTGGSSTTAAREAVGEVTREIVDATGNAVTVPADPQRIVALGEIEIDTLLALDIEPVGIINGRGQDGPPHYLADRLDDIPVVGSAGEADYEAIANLEPDLVLAYVDAEVAAQLEKITPATVVTLPDGEYDWRENVRLVAEAVNRADDGEQLLADYEDRVEEVRTALGERATAQISIIRWMPDGPQLIGGRASAAEIAKQIGFSFPPEQDTSSDGGAHSDPLSLENLSKLDSEHIFVGVLQPSGQQQAALDAGLESPAWTQLGAVQRGAVTVVDGSLWTSLVGVLGANMVLDQIAEALGT